jgi:cyclophilin family peptidyl-prolyl cis-trans isomerase
VYILMTTNKGDILLELDPVKAPVSVSNFLSYVQEGFYRDTIFHRVMANFMIQGGGFTVEFQRKPTSAAIVNEWKNGLKNARGTIAMARTNAPDSATSQFFINLKDNTNLDAPISGGAAYAVFGRVVAGMDVVDAIAAVPVKPGRLNPAERSEPVDPVLITQVVRLSAQEARQRQETAGRT